MAVEMSDITRRGFLVGSAAGAGALAAGLMLGKSGSSEFTGGQTLVVARHDSSVSGMVDGCVNALGGIENFISPGEAVAIKINGSWTSSLASVRIDVLERVVQLVQSASPSSILIYDHTIQTGGWPRVATAASSLGVGEKEYRDDGDDYVQCDVPGVGLGSIQLTKAVRECDALINLSKLKTHGNAEVTVSLKNHMGSVKDRGAIHTGGGKGLSQAIADLNTCPHIAGKQRVCIVDAVNPMVTGGPSSGNLADYSGVLAGTDPVATDYVGTQIIRRYNSEVSEKPKHLRKAAELGLGTCDPSNIQFDEQPPTGEVPESAVPLVIGGVAAAILARRSRG